MSCRLSVIVASYNYERFIEKVLYCLVDQSCKCFEIIVVDDGSWDSSVKIINEFVLNYRSIKLVTHEGRSNKGLSATVQLGIKHSSGEYIAFCESDDFWEKNHVKYLFEFMDMNPEADIIYNKIKCINNSSYKNYDTYVNQCNNFLSRKSSSNIFEDIFLENWMPTFSASCVRKKIISCCDFNSPVRPYLDFWLWRQICLRNKVYFSDNAVTLWNKHDTSYDMTHNVSDLKDFIYKSNDLLINRCINKVEEKIKYYDEIEDIENINEKINFQRTILKKYLKY